MNTLRVTKPWSHWFRHHGGVGLRAFSKRDFYQWGYMGNNQVIYDYFSMWQMGGEL